MTRIQRGAAVLLLAVFLACDGSPTGSTEISAAARAHLDAVIAALQTRSLHKNSIDWAALRADVFAEAGAAQTIADTYPAIRRALILIGDGHTSYQGADGTIIFVPTRTCQSFSTGVPNLPGTIGYTRVTSFNGSSADALAYANTLQNMIRQFDHEGITGWIVDLRGNQGGNMWPMLAGIGPVLGEGLAGRYIDVSGTEVPWEYAAGAARRAGAEMHRVNTPYQLINPGIRVAVLTDGWVASAAEGIAISFRGRPNARSFGTATCGLSTGHTPTSLGNGAVIYVTSSVMADRTGATYGDAVVPDEVITDPQVLIQRAVQWLQTGE